MAALKYRFVLSGGCQHVTTVAVKPVSWWMFCRRATEGLSVSAVEWLRASEAFLCMFMFSSSACV